MVARARFAVLALALAVCSVALAAMPSPVPAATYDVFFCEALTPVDGFTVVADPQGSSLASGDSCGTPTPSLLQTGAGSAFSDQRGKTSWTLAAPNPSIHLVSLSGFLSITGPWDTNTAWAVKDGNGNLLDSYDGPSHINPLHGSGPFMYPVTGDSLTSTLACPNATGCSLSSLAVTFTNLKATVEDKNGPAVDTVGGSLVAGGTLSGGRTATFGAADAGSGVATVALLVDGSRQPNLAFTDDNGGSCRVPYNFFVPCSQTENPSFEVETARFADGTHTVQAEAIDAAGNVSTSAPKTITTRNAPTSTAPPAIQGTPQLGSTLTATNGTWAGNASGFTYQWLRCPASVTSAAGAGGCTAISGATGAQYTLTSADIYGRAIVKVTASNGSVSTADAFSEPTGSIADANGRTTPPPGGGGGGGGNGGGGIDRTPPVLSAVSLTRARFAIAKARTAIAALVRGTVLRLTSSEGGRLSIAVVRVRPGQRKGRVCRAVRRPVRRRACTLLTRVATLTRSIGAGRTGVALSGRIGSRPLAPGSYRLVLTVRDGSANVSKAVQRSFTIVRG